MSGEFLPPVVTTLDGDIQPLLDKLAKAKAAIKALGDTKFNIPVNLELNKQSVAKTKAETKAAFDKPIIQVVKTEADMLSAYTARQAAEAMFRNPIIAHIRFEADGHGVWAAPRAITAGRSPLAITAGNAWTGPTAFHDLGWRASSLFNNPQMFFGGGPQPDPGRAGYWSRGTYYPGDNGGGFLGGLAGAWANRPFQSYPTRDFPAPWFLGGGRLTYTTAHTALMGAGALGMGAMGALFGAGSMGLVLGPGMSHAYGQINGLSQSVLSTIPPGTPDYALYRALGFRNMGPNSPIARASVFGSGMDLSIIGGLIAMGNKGGILSQLMANTGLAGGSGLANMIARMDLAAQHPQTLQRFIGNINSDASNIGQGFRNLGAFAGHTFSHMPGELEWLTTGFRNITGWANDAWHVPVLKSILGDAAFGGMLWHSTGTMAHLLGNGLKFASKLPLIGRIPGLADAGAGLAGMGFMSLPVMLAAAGIGTGLAAYRYQTPTSAAINAIKNGIGLGSAGPINTGTYSNNILGSLGLFAHGAATGSTKQSWLGQLFTQTMGGGYRQGSWQDSLANFMTFGLYNKELSPSQQNAWALQQALPGYFSYGSSINSVASALHVSTAMAAQIMAMDGAKMGKHGIVGGNAMAIRLAQNYLNGNRIVNGSTGMALMNIGVANTVGDSAWKAAQQINGNWDAYFGAMTGGAQGLNSLYAALAGTGTFNPASKLAASLGSAKIGLIPTAAGIQSAGMPTLDFFRQAMSVGAIHGNAFQQSALQLAGSLMPLAGNSKTAQDMLLALARSSGATVKNFADLKRQTGGAANAEHNLTNSVASTIDAMTRLGPFASAVMKQIQADTVSMFAAVIAKSPAAKNAMQSLLTQMASGHPVAKTMNADMQTLFTYLHNKGMTVSQISGFFHDLGVNLDKIPNYIRKELHIVTNAKQAAADFASAAAAWAGVPNGQTKYDSVYTSVAAANQNTWVQHAVGIHKHTGATHTALGVRDRIMGGWSWVGERGPELMYQPSGTHVIPAHRTGQTVAAAMAMGSSAMHGDIHIYVDGKELFGVVKHRTYDYNTQNGNRTRGGRMAGTLRPRP